MGQRFDKDFKYSAVKYYMEHRDLGLVNCARNIGISQQSLSRSKKELQDTGEIVCRGSGNYASDAEKENAGLKKKLRDTEEALEILKKAIGILGN